jgi:hypothetical protein
MGVSPTTAKLLALKSGNRCAKPGCPRHLTESAIAYDPEVVIGQIAHIVGQANNGPRADPSMSREDRDAEDNLVLLCRDHHAIADRQENTYTVDELRRWKRDHERQVDLRMEALVGEITFLELELVADAVASTPLTGNAGFTLTEVREKMAKNALTDRVSHDMSVGMLGADLVKDYVAERAAMSPDFPERLRGGFVAEYERLHAEALRGDDLFLALRAFASPPHEDLKRQVAGLAVLVHLFRICEVFQP